jgi:hypothetical protein
MAPLSCRFDSQTTASPVVSPSAREIRLVGGLATPQAKLRPCRIGQDPGTRGLPLNVDPRAPGRVRVLAQGAHTSLASSRSTREEGAERA